jgi:hypothetical protein
MNGLRFHNSLTMESRSGLGIATSLAIWFLSMRETPVDQHGKIDYVGSALGTSSLILFNFVWK